MPHMTPGVELRPDDLYTAAGHIQAGVTQRVAQLFHITGGNPGIPARRSLGRMLLRLFESYGCSNALQPDYSAAGGHHTAGRMSEAQQPPVELKEGRRLSLLWESHQPAPHSVGGAPGKRRGPEGLNCRHPASQPWVWFGGGIDFGRSRNLFLRFVDRRISEIDTGFRKVVLITGANNLHGIYCRRRQGICRQGQVFIS